MKHCTWRSAAPKLCIPEQFIRCGRKILFCVFETHFARNIPAHASAGPRGLLSNALTSFAKRRDEDISRRRAGRNGNGGATIHSPFARASLVSRNGAGGLRAFGG